MACGWPGWSRHYDGEGAADMCSQELRQVRWLAITPHGSREHLGTLVQRGRWQYAVGGAANSSVGAVVSLNPARDEQYWGLHVEGLSSARAGGSEKNGVE
jgi:hypothetical protein